MEHGLGVTIISMFFCVSFNQVRLMYLSCYLPKNVSSLCLREACLQIVMIDTKILCKKLCL